MRFGFTTGSCAAAAAKAAAYMLLTGEVKERVSIVTPKGIAFDAEILDIVRTRDSVTCGVRKDAGDDPVDHAGDKAEPGMADAVDQRHCRRVGGNIIDVEFPQDNIASYSNLVKDAISSFEEIK